jgi:hypothetical protein
MKYPLPIAIATLCVFAFMAFIIMDGTLTFGTPRLPSHFIAVQSVQIACAVEQATRETTVLNQRATSMLQQHCNGKPSCEVDTSRFYATGERLESCTDEIHIIYKCTPRTEASQVFLYEGQRGSLACDQVTNVK